MTTDRPIASAPERDPKANKAGLIMLALFGVGSLFFVCGGALALGFSAANNSEREAVQLSYFILSPMGGALAGLITSIITHFAVKQNIIAKIAIPLIAAFFGIPCVLGCVVFFYEAIWPSL